MVVITVPSRGTFSPVYDLSKSALETSGFCLGQIWCNVDSLISVALVPVSTSTIILALFIITSNFIAGGSHFRSDMLYNS